MKDNILLAITVFVTVIAITVLGWWALPIALACGLVYVHWGE